VALFGFEFRLKRSAGAATSDELLDSECSFQKTAGRKACMVFGERPMRAKRPIFHERRKIRVGCMGSGGQENRFYLTLTVIFSETSGGSNG
jgi:hypothetical protein